ncbi:MAG: hypothetical protein NC314_08760 [Roseburia sp.]|nr:hypothetical protein [Roseburia sp.]MCM1242918.1 hypothetical protein [Roseburia sp.]
MEKLIDIHSHILFGMDDGAGDLDTSIQMLRIAAKDGISAIILTPHNKPGHHRIDSARVAEKMAQLKTYLAQEDIAIRLYLGNELYYRSRLIWEIEDGQAYTLAGSRYVLVEFSPSDDYGYIRNGINEILMGGYYPILAHVERYRNVCMKKDGITDLADMGCYIQVNADSIMGKYGMKTASFTRKLLKQHLVHFIASDAHDPERRAPHLAGCAAYVTRKYGESYAGKLFVENPERILEDGAISAGEE